MKSWCPFAIRNLAPRHLWLQYTGGVFNGLLHTTESRNFWPAEGSYYGHSSYPHFTVVLREGKAVTYQHIPIDHAARALRNKSGGVQTNTDRVVQIEIAWKAAEADTMPKALLREVRRLMHWIEQQTGIQPVAPAFVAYPASYGENAKQRFTGERWEKFTGWCGHQHAPENTHGDPGAINVKFLLSKSYRTIRRLRARIRRLEAKLAEKK